MERLWTPWRRTYLESGSPTPGCFLCTSPEARDDAATLIVFRAPSVFVILNRYPYNSGHLLVAPYEHTGDFASLGSAAELIAVTQKAVSILADEYKPHAFNVGMNLGKSAGAGVPDHLHMHIVPRWDGDTNFMPVVGETKVLPESLDQTYERLSPRFR